MVTSVYFFSAPCCNCSRLRYKMQKTADNSQPMSQCITSRRNTVLFTTVSLLPTFISCVPTSAVKAEEIDSKREDDEGGRYQCNEDKTKTGKILPKSYLKAAREVVKTLRESLEEDGHDVGKFRRNADAAKESIREYLIGWRGQPLVISEASYVALEKAIRALASFYSKAGPFASMPGVVKSAILDDLKTAEAVL